MTDKTAAILAKEGGEDGYRELYERHREGVYRLAYRYAGSAQDAEDILQETFIKAFNSIQRFSVSENPCFASWIRRICLHRCIEHLRQRKRRRRDQTTSFSDFRGDLADGISPERSADIRLLITKVRQALVSLSPKQRIIFDMRYFEQREVPEIARMLGCSESAVKTHLSRAETKLRDELAPIVEEL